MTQQLYPLSLADADADESVDVDVDLDVDEGGTMRFRFERFSISARHSSKTWAA